MQADFDLSKSIEEHEGCVWLEWEFETAKAIQIGFEECPDGLVDDLKKWCNEVASSNIGDGNDL